MWIWLISAIVILVLVVFALGSRRADIRCRVSPREGIEDIDVVRAYDQISRWPQFRLLRKIIVKELRNYSPDGVLVDVGCGPGYLVVQIARSFPRLGVIGVDISEEMVQKAADTVSGLGLGEKVSFRQGDIRELPVASDSVDFVVSTLSLHHWSEPGLAIEEINRVLKPGGQFLIFDARRDSRRLFYWLFRFAQTFVLPEALERINEPTSSFLAGYTPAELDSLMSGSSFNEWKIKPGVFWLFVWGRKT